MCEAWPGPRCSYDMSKKLDARKVKLAAAIKTHGADSPAATLAAARYQYTQTEYDATPEGIKALEEQIDSNPDDKTLKDRLQTAKSVRVLQANALSEVRNGRVSELSNLIDGITDFHDREEVSSIIESSREETERYVLRKKAEINFESNEARYHKFVNNIESALVNKYGSPLPLEYQKSLANLRVQSAPDAVSMEAYEKLPKGLDRSRRQLISEIKNAAALQGVDAKVAAEYYEAYRKQYQQQFADLPASERPDPPESWVRGEFGQSGYAKDPNSNYAPHDPASAYAIYRLRADDNAIPDYMKNSLSIASIDLEVAGPAGTEGMEPEFGKIIEVGIISYNPQGKRVGEYSQLVKPDDAFLDKYDTGAQKVHGIERQHLSGKPSWGFVQTQVATHLKGKILLAQNAAFEAKWLNYHLDEFDAKRVSIVDPMEISRKHYDLPNHKLQTICENNGVAYTGGHRATHDAEVAAAAYFKQRKKIRQTWASKPARNLAPALTEIPSGSRWNRKKP